jgi:peptidoglycan/LPS O-acetylase OafA/YrhL
MIWFCVSGNGGIINKFLSLKIFVPLARLTYSVYLVHAWILWYFVGSRRNLIDVNIYDICAVFLHHLIMSYIIGLVFFVLFESPIIETQKYVIKLLRKKYDKNFSVELKNLK